MDMNASFAFSLSVVVIDAVLLFSYNFTGNPHSFLRMT